MRNATQITKLTIINSILENVFMEERLTAYSWFKLRFSATSTKDFENFSCFCMVCLSEIPEYLVLIKFKKIWGPKCSGPLPYGLNVPPMKGPGSSALKVHNISILK